MSEANDQKEVSASVQVWAKACCELDNVVQPVYEGGMCLIVLQASPANCLMYLFRMC
jgi:hypothetical protein